MQRIINLTYILMIFVMLQSGGMVSAGHGLVDPAQGIPLFLKIITYDDNFNSDSIGIVDIYFVYDEKQVESYLQLSLAEEYFRSNSGLKVAEIKVSFQPVAVGKLNSYLNKLSDTAYSVLIVTELEENQLNLIKEKTAGLKIRSFSFNPEHVKLGYSVSIRLRDKKIKIVVNLDAAHEEGSEFGAHLLKMCDIYKN